MARFILRRLSLIPLALFCLNFIGFAYAHLARPLRAARNPSLAWIAQDTPPLLPTYGTYLQNSLQLDFGTLPSTTQEPISTTILRTGAASLGLLAVALGLAVVVGLILGLLATQNDPPRTARWLMILSTLGLATPSFYLGSMLILSMFYLILYGHNATAGLITPTAGFGWDNHLILPTLTLMLHPAVQIAQVTSAMMTAELGKQYVTTARSIGLSWSVVRRRHVLRNILATLILTVGSAFRLLMGELIIVEWLFQWPGLGRLLATTLIPADFSGALGGALFLDPPTVAALFTVFGGLFLTLDLIAAITVRVIDPRLHIAEEPEVSHV